MLITRDQIRAARALKDWSQSDLAKRTGLARPTIVNIESGNQEPNAKTLDKIFEVFESNDIEFGADEAVRMKSTSVKILQGINDFWTFFDDVYNTMRTEGGAIYVSNCKNELFMRIGGDKLYDHAARMTDIKDNFTCKTLVQENDTFLPGIDYTEYRWLPKEEFGSIPFYVYGNKLGILLLSDNPLIFLLDHPEAAKAYTKYFMTLWDKAVVLPKSKKLE